MRGGWTDVAVVGAGPAGSAAAALLAERGVDVTLVERAVFPRAKPCAEYLSPQVTRVLDRLGVRAAVEGPDAGASKLTGMRLVAPDGSSVTGRFVASHGFRGHSDYGLALRRERFDALLVEAAVRRGARLLENTIVENLGEDSGRYRTLSIRSGGRRDIMRARLIVAADGLNTRIGRVLGVSRRRKRRRIAFVTHAVGVAGMGDVGEMYVGRNGYAGLAPLGEGVTNVAVVVDLARVRIEKPPQASFNHLLRDYPAVCERLRSSTRVSPVRAVGPFGRWVSRATADRVVLVGDAADFHDPFTGEGVYAALHGAELLSEATLPALARDQLSKSALAPYDAARRRAFGGKWTVERLVSWAVAHPGIFNHITHRLAARPELADVLVAVTGNFAPPHAVLRTSFAWQLIK